jgi:phenylalanyl-tRNA synthetase beta chain
MKISLAWLADYIDHGLTVDELPAKLAMLGLPVESVTRLGQGFSGVIVAEVREKGPHPKADKLTLVKIWDGQGAFDVVCGASNVPAPGGKVLWARPGATLPGGLTIAAKELRGVMSAGMLCSTQELGLEGSKADGIVVLPEEDSAMPGATAQQALGLDDTVLDVELTPNRGDCLSHLGLARELSALTGRPLRVPTQAHLAVHVEDAFPVTIEDPQGCARYTARLIDGVKVGPSPAWMKHRLEAVGVRPLSNLVDVTNYVMFDVGQPLHAFDLDKLAGPRIVVRRARAGERLVTLDGQDRALEDGDLVICDAKGPVALAGVMGGAATEVTAGTTRILLEAATFDPRSVRRTARRLGLHSESSHRFERGVDQPAIAGASSRAAMLMCTLAGGRIMPGFADVEPRPYEAPRITLRPERAAKLLGFDTPEPEIRRTLGALGIDVQGAEGTHVLTCTPPSYRRDLTLEADLIEEIVRMVGYERIPATLPVSQARPQPAAGLRAEAARSALAAAGLYEAITYGFTSPARLAALRLPDGHPIRRPVALKNPLREELSVMRTSLVPNLLAAVAHNLAHGHKDVQLFEIGSVFLASGRKLPDEPVHAAGVMAGSRAGWLQPQGPLDVFDLRGVVEHLFASLGLEVDFVQARNEEGFLHPGVGAAILCGGQHVGVLGEVHVATREALGVFVPCFAFDVNLDLLPAAQRPMYRGVTRFPGVVRDVSFFVADFTPAARVREVLRQAQEPLLREIHVLEDYREPGRVPEGKKGMLWSLTYRSPERTLTDAEVDAVHEQLVARLLGELRGQRR